MFLMMAEVLRLAAVSAKLPDSAFWSFLAYHQTHVTWAGCSLHDLIQPSFSFLVGVSLPFSIASRVAKGQSRGHMIAHAVWRAVLLVLLGVFLRSMNAKQTNWTFEDTLSQIGFGYVPLFLLGFTCRRWQWAAFIVILIGYWAAFALYPLPPSEFDYGAVGAPTGFPHYISPASAGTALGGVPSESDALRSISDHDAPDAMPFAAHWNKNSNLAWAFDKWFLNLFPRPPDRTDPETGKIITGAFTHNRGGYATLSFIPTLATMILGLLAGGWLRTQGAVASSQLPSGGTLPVSPTSPLRAPHSALRAFVLTGLALLALGLAAHYAGLCPNVKRIWTPTWTLFSGGLCFLILAAFYAAIDVAHISSWSFPLRVIGANSIAAYILAHGPDRFLADSLKIHFGTHWPEAFGAAYAPLLLGSAVLALEWLVLYWLYRNKVHIRI